ncbi:MAG: hypothetical protein AAFR46_13195 [Pseudomonadota bacterium]
MADLRSRLASPVLFPACLGALGSGIALEHAVSLGVPQTLATAWQVIAAGLYLACLAAYAARVVRQPELVMQDIRPPPMRGTLSAGAMGLMLLAALLLQISQDLARAVWLLGIALHLASMIAVTVTMFATRGQGFAASPVLYLPFVGLVVAPIAGLPLGETPFSALVLYAALPSAAMVALAVLVTLFLGPVPPAQRAAQAIHLAPVSLIGTGASGLGNPALFLAAFAVASLVATLLVLRLRWITAGGWHPGWSAFTFPSAAFAVLCMTFEGWLPGHGVVWFAWPALVTACAVTLWTLARLLLPPSTRG